MEVASPLTLGPNSGVVGTKRSLQICSPLQHALVGADDIHERMMKRRRFHVPTEIDSLSENFSSQSSLFFTGLSTTPQPKSAFASNGASSLMKRVVRMATPTDVSSTNTNLEQHDTKHKELERMIQDQKIIIETLQTDKGTIEKSFTTLKSDHERIMKENHILRKAVTIQEERRIHSEQDAKAYKVQAEERIRSLEQLILTLRYHLQAQQSVSNDFMHQRPPDVY